MSAEQALSAAGAEIDAALKTLLRTYRSDHAGKMYDMLSYCFGFLDTNLQPSKTASGGKRLRSALCLLIAEGYGARQKALTAALAIETFHNFTLIHDDVEDADELRRNKPTLWKLFGVNHAINAGDALSLIASELCVTTEPQVARILFAAWTEVIEGQYLDFELTSQPVGSDTVNVAHYMRSTEKKTAALFAAAAEAAGMCAGKDESECAHLRAYGTSLGIAFQLADDYRSIWGTQTETGKDAYGDIREHKRTLPFFAAYEETSKRARLTELYDLDRQLSETEITEMRIIIDATSARSQVLQEIRAYADQARNAAEQLTLAPDIRNTIEQLISVLIPETNE
jgi:geranylgeranyl diphosphate synthase type I